MLGAFDWISPKRWDKRSKLRSLGQQRPAYIQKKIRAGFAHWSVRSWSVHSMLTQPWGLYRGRGFEPAERKNFKKTARHHTNP
ncbi:hypothetical protein IEO21_07950 [Rhodonia placenta]|uniref:Uncharacterized protein n=1 Tax=Rhodonia placenta TaxID=104341 RepID=A0A8H7TZ99_9APHY|nr:hypothetical protein IEO21_07950 [Postia placenta]